MDVFFVKRVREVARILMNYLWQHKKEVIILLSFAWLVLAFADLIIPIVTVAIFGMVATFSTSYKKVIRLPPAFELVTFTTVMVSLAYGPMVGAIYAIVVSLTSEVMATSLDFFIVSFIPGRIVMAIAAGFLLDLFNGNVIAVGAVSSVFYNGMSQPLYLLLSDVEMRLKSLYFVFINICSNLMFFLVFGNLVASFLKIG